MTMSNNKIYNLANALGELFSSDEMVNKKLPVRINFYIMKNRTEIIRLGQELEQERVNIIHKYGEEQEDGSWAVLQENMDDAQNELRQLFNIEQPVRIYKVNIEDFGDVELTPKEMDTLMFMINDPKEEEE